MSSPQGLQVGVGHGDGGSGLPPTTPATPTATTPPRQPHHRSGSVRRIRNSEAMAATADVVSYAEEHQYAYADDDQTLGLSLGASTIRTDDVGDDVTTRLYAICACALPGADDPPLHEMTPKQRSAREEQLDATWEALREWLTAHPTEEERSVAATHVGEFSMTALHLLCKLPNPPIDVVSGVISCELEVASWQDSNGWLGLHHAVANGASIEVLATLCDAFPDGKTTQDKRRRTPLHFAFFRSQASGVGGGSDGDNGNADDELAEIFTLLGDTGAATLPDEGGLLPMHYACAYGTTTSVLEVLHEQCPQSCAARELKGRTPLHLAMVNAHRSASPDAVQFLLRTCPQVVDMADDSGYLAISLLATSMIVKLGHDKPDAEKNAALCLQYYLDAKPTPTADFLSAVQSLPEWLRDKAVSSEHLHKVLNERIVQRFPTSILLMDGYIYLLIIVVFSLNSRWNINYRFDNEAVPTLIPLYVQFVGGAYFLAREMAQVISMSALGTFKKWLFDVSNWLDMSVIFLVFYYGVLMIDPTLGVSDEMFRGGVAVTQGILWIAVIIYLKSTLVDFAVFVGGVVYVVRRLLAFMVSLGVILFAFAQSFYYVFSMTPSCPRDPTTGELYGQWDYENPHCTFGRSLLKVYTMILGEIGDTTRFYKESTVSQVLYVLYAFLVVILLANVLIAIVTDSYGIIKNERAAMVFWSNRLDFVAEMDAISNAVNLIVTCGAVRPLPSRSYHAPPDGMAAREGWRGGSHDDQTTATDKTKGPSSPFRSGWDALMSLFDPNLFKENEVSSLSIDFWCYIALRIFVALFVIPLWILAGFVTAGWLWPPQVREFLFAQRRAAVSRADIAEEVKNEVTKLKTELTDLRVELKHEMKKDKNGLSDMKSDLDSVQDDVLADVKQVKDILTTLFELNRERVRGGR